MILAFLAGMAFVFALVAVAIASAERARAQQIEQVLGHAVSTLQAAVLKHGNDLVDLSHNDVTLAQDHADFMRLVQMVVANHSTEKPSTPQRALIVPGPRRLQ